MARTLALALSLLALTVGEAQATTFRVTYVPGLSLESLPTMQARGAVGLLVPGAGPETSQRLALASLVRGEVENSLRDGVPDGPPLIPVERFRGLVIGEATIVVGIPRGDRQANDRRYPVLVVGGGYEGVLVSDSTRIPGLVSIADIAPTARGRGSALDSRPNDDAARDLLALDRRIEAHNDVLLPATLLAFGLVLVLALAFPHAAVLGLGAALAANLALGAAGVTSLWAVLLVVGLAIGIGAPLLALVLRSPLAHGIALAVVVAGYLATFAVDGTWVALSPFGPTQNARFYGLSNLLETLLLVPALAAAALLGSRLGAGGFALVALLAFVTVAGNRFGADGGGAVVLAAGFAVAAALMTNARGRTLAAALAGAAVLALVLVSLDAATGGASHVTDSLRGGPTEVMGDLRDRVTLSWHRITGNWYTTFLVAVLAAGLVALVARTLRRGPREPHAAVPLAVASAIAVSLVVNDSPREVLLGGLVGYLAAERSMLPGRWDAASSSPCSLLRFPWPPAAAAKRPSRPRPRP